ncbi:succinate-semialdehyde dehydrogenase (NADP(+)) [Flindersiella endophytica]
MTVPATVSSRVAGLTTRVVADSGETMKTTAPATGEPLATIPVSTPEDVAVAFDRARKAQAEWAATPVRHRSAMLLRYHDLVLDRMQDILDVIQAESGKARKHAFEEPCDVALNSRYYARRAPHLLRPHHRAGLIPGLTRTQELRHPKGVVGVISPWNYPFTMALSDGIAALAAGNAIVSKPASQTALTALYGVELLAEAGMPEDLWQVVIGEGSVVGGAIVDHADFVCFTGSTATGRQIAKRAGERLIGCTLELGGKNPLLVLDDADLELAAETATRACFSNAGQLCISTERLYIAEKVYDAFVDRFVRNVEAIRLDATYDFGPDMGSLISEQQLKTVSTHLADARDKGAKVLTGGEHRPDIGPYFFEPTVLENVAAGMTCHREETFGPLVSVYRVADDEAAIAAANDSSYGLNAAVFSRDVSRGRAVASRLQVGTVNVNEAYSPAWGSIDSPMGGFKDSGLGRRHGAEGLLKYTEGQTVATQRVPLKPIGSMTYDTFAKSFELGLKAFRRIGRR